MNYLSIPFIQDSLMLIFVAFAISFRTLLSHCPRKSSVIISVTYIVNSRLEHNKVTKEYIKKYQVQNSFHY